MKYNNKEMKWQVISISKISPRNFNGTNKIDLRIQQPNNKRQISRLIVYGYWVNVMLYKLRYNAAGIHNIPIKFG